MKIISKKGEGDKNLKFALKELSSNLVAKVGWFPSAKYENGTQVAQVAVTQEFGNAKKKIPPRPFMRPAIKKNQAKYKSMAKSAAVSIIRGELTANQFLERLAADAMGDIRVEIVNKQSPPLKNRTIDARTRRTAAFKKLKTDKAKNRMLKENRANETFRKPLVDTSILLNSISWSVEKK